MHGMQRTSPPSDDSAMPHHASPEDFKAYLNQLDHIDFASLNEPYADLPPTPPAGVTIDVFLLRLGSMPVPMKLMEMVEGRTGIIELASYVFLIEHTRDGVKKRILFDLGMRRLDAEMAPHAKHAMALFNCVCPLGAARTLAMNGVDPSSIDAIIISHTHWDHRGDVQDFPKSTEVVLGVDTPADLAFELDIRPEELAGRNIRILNRQDEWYNVGAFKGVDYFGDGTLMLLHTPGHKKGHVAGLLRTNAGVHFLLGGDLCHHCCLLQTEVGGAPKPRLGCFSLPGTNGVYRTNHENPKQAYDTIARAEEMDKDPRVVVWLAHDDTWDGIIPEGAFVKVPERDAAFYKKRPGVPRPH